MDLFESTSVRGVLLEIMVTEHVGYVVKYLCTSRSRNIDMWFALCYDIFSITL